MKQTVIKDDQSPAFIIVPEEIKDDKRRIDLLAFENGIVDYVVEVEPCQTTS